MKNWLTYEIGSTINFQKWEPQTLVTFDPAMVIRVSDPGYTFPHSDNCCAITFSDGATIAVMKTRSEVIADLQSAL
jgi:hypothetical protein